MSTRTRIARLLAATALAISGLAAPALTARPASAHTAHPSALSIDVLVSGPESVPHSQIPFTVRNVVPGPGPELSKKHTSSRLVEVCGGLEVDVDPSTNTVRVSSAHNSCGYARIRVTVSAPYIRNLRVVSDDLITEAAVPYTRNLTASASEVSALWVDPVAELVDADAHVWAPPSGSAVFTWDTKPVRPLNELGITGKPAVKNTLTVVNAVPANFDSPDAKVAVQWLRKGKVIKGATSPTYRPTRADKGKKLTARVTTTAFGMAPSVLTLTSAKVKRR